MRRPAVIAVSLTLCVYFSPRGEGQSRPGKKTGESTTQNEKRANPPVVPVPYSIENQWIQTEAQHRESEPPPWYRSPEWVLVIVGCITAIFIAWQSLETRNAARAGQKAAEAALANAKAIIGAERSWITVLPYIWSPTLYPRWEAGDPIPESGVLSPVFHKLPVQIKNTGRTPAKIDELRMFYIHTPQHPTFQNMER